MGGPKWKREVFQDHKFDYIDVKSFTSHGILLWAGYLWVYIDILKSIAVLRYRYSNWCFNRRYYANASHFLIGF